MKEHNIILMLGVGTAGTRAAYYIHQRNGCTRPNWRIMGLDSDREALSQLPLMNTRPLPAAPALPTGHNADEARLAADRILDDCCSADLIVLLACLGGYTASFYSQAILDYARKHGIRAIAVAGLPHDTDSEEEKNRAAATLGVLQAQHFDILTLDCAGMGALFPTQNREAAYQQAIIWLCNAATGYVELFSEPLKQSDTPPEEPPDFSEMPRGIFLNCRHTFIDNVDMDIPTYLRRQIKLPLD